MIDGSEYAFGATQINVVLVTQQVFALTQPAITCSKLTIETLEQGANYVQS